MFTLFGDYSKDIDSVYDALLEVCRKDPLFPSYWKADPVHNDGWGYVTMTEDAIDFKRYAMPIFDSERPRLTEHGILIVHARKAAPGEPIGVLDAHPHHRGDSDYDVYLVHNGSFNKEKIAEKLGDTNLGNQPDSEFFLQYIMSLKGTIEERIRKTLEDADKYDFVKTTNNIFILAADKKTGKGRLFYYGYSKRGEDYIKMYRVENERWKGVVSSSLLKSSHFPKDVKVTEVVQRELVELT